MKGLDENGRSMNETADRILEELREELETSPTTAILRFGEPRVVRKGHEISIDIAYSDAATLVIHIGSGYSQFRFMVKDVSYSITEAWTTRFDDLTLTEIRRYIETRVKPALENKLHTMVQARYLVSGDEATRKVVESIISRQDSQGD